MLAKSRTTIVAAAVLALATVLLAACTSSGGGTSPSSGASATVPSGSGSSSVTKAPPSPTLVQNSVPQKVANKADLRKYVIVTACTQTDKGWQASGTAKNSGDKNRTFAITIFFTTPKATVQDFAATKVKVDSGKTGKWSAKKNFAAVKGTRCVLRGVG